MERSETASPSRLCAWRFRAGLAIAGCCWLALGLTAAADDTIRKVGGESVKGSIKYAESTALELVVERTSGDEKIPVIEIDRVLFDGEPIQLRTVRDNVANGAYANAIKGLDRILENAKEKPIESEGAQVDLEFYRVVCLARLAQSNEDVSKAGALAKKFVDEHPTNYHFFAAQELLGNLYTRYKKYDAARRAYETLAKTPYQEWKMRAGAALGRMAMDEGKFDVAKKEFEGVLELAKSASSPRAEAESQAAELGRARCLAETGGIDEAIKSIEDLIGKMNPEEVELHALAYNTLGHCYRKKPDVKAAMVAFLHVEEIYFSDPQAHAEALYHLALLYNLDGKPERALEATNALKERYPNSVWVGKQ